MADRLPGIAPEVLASVQQHRLLHTMQVHEMHTPDTGLRYTQRMLVRLQSAGLLAAVTAGTRLKHWHLTAAGLDLVMQIPDRVEPRPKLLTADQANSALSAHTLAVNDVGLAYLRTAREREDDFDPFSWRHEVAHPIGPEPGRRQHQQLIADALLSYLRFEDGRVHHHQRFLELDRATMPIQQLIIKLRHYQRLRTYTPLLAKGKPAGEPAWTSAYRALPQVQIVLAGKPRPALVHRLQVLLALCTADPKLAADRELGMSVCLLEDLTEHGPFAAIWHQPQNPSQPVDWLGRQTKADRR